MTDGERTCGDLLRALSADSVKRLKWRVMERLHICPVSLRALLLTNRRALEFACHLALDAGERAAPAKTETAPASVKTGENPGFDMARFRALAGR